MPKSDPPSAAAADPPSAGGEASEGRDRDDERESSRRRGRGDEPDLDVRGSFERILPELLRRGLSAGRERVGESIFPRELTTTLIAHMGDIRSGVVKAVAQEVKHFLREADIASELRKVMAGLDVKAEVRLRFSEREDGGLEPHLDVKVPEAPKTPKTPKPPKPSRTSNSEPAEPDDV